MNRTFKCILYTLIVGSILYLGALCQLKLVEYQSIYYNAKPLILFSGLFPIFVRFVLRLPELIMNIKHKNQQWGVDWVKVIVMGLPSLFIASYPLFYYLGIPMINAYLTEILLGSMFTTISGVIFGYVFIDSTSKKA